VFLNAAGEDSGDVPLDAELWDAAFVPGEVPPAPLPPMPEAAPAGPLAGGYLSPAVTAAADGAAHPPPAPQRPGAHLCRACVSPLKAAAMSKPHSKLHCVLGCLMVPSVPAVSIGSGHEEPVHPTAIPLRDASRHPFLRRSSPTFCHRLTAGKAPAALHAAGAKRPRRLAFGGDGDPLPAGESPGHSAALAAALRDYTVPEDVARASLTGALPISLRALQVPL